MTGDARREQILDTTEAIVEADGWHAVSIDRVAREAGITRPVVYTHFGDLDGLLNALVDRANARTLEALGRIVPREPEEDSPGEFLEGALRRFLETVREDPVTWRLALLPPESAPQALRRDVDRRRAAIERRIRALVTWGAARLAIPEGALDLEVLSRMILSHCEEQGRLLLQDERFDRARLIAGTAGLLAAVAWRPHDG
jgi:AcrR family transcriptional regulator